MNSKIIVLSVLFTLSNYIPISHLKPLFPNCNRVPEGQIGRFRDTENCTIFYHCIRGQKPLVMECPKLPPYETQLYYNPVEMACGPSYRALESCFPPPCVPPNCYTGPYYYEPTTTTTTELTTTARAPKPPKLDDQPDFEIDCQGDKSCGLFPNTYGSCDKFIVCVNGQKVEKNCNAGFLFDTKTKECQPSHLATCWKEPEPSKHVIDMDAEHCPFHEHPVSTPVATEKDGIILQNPVVTNYGKWQDWTYCPKGMYAKGINTERTIIEEGSKVIDNFGAIGVSFKCQTPGGNETDRIIESWAPNAPNYGWSTHYMCKGAVVGITLNSVKKNGKDEIGTDYVLAVCSCMDPLYKTFDQPPRPLSGVAGEWTATQFCKEKQAVCGMQTQMQEYKENMNGQYDNNGLNNMKVKCCDVPNPVDVCVPKEDRIHIRDCDNTNGDESLICEFESMVGLSYDYDTQADASDFYTSIGYTFDDVKDKLSKKIVSKLDGDIKRQGSYLYQYTWDDIDEPAVLEDVTVAKKTLIVKRGDKVMLYQFVGRCGHFIIRTNKYLRLIQKGKFNIPEYFEV